MYFEANKTRSSFGFRDANADIPVRPSKSLYCWQMHVTNLEWACDTIGELEHDLAVLESKEPDASSLYSNSTLDGRPRTIENCKADIAGIRSLKFELDTETNRLRAAKDFWAHARESPAPEIIAQAPAAVPNLTNTWASF